MLPPISVERVLGRYLLKGIEMNLPLRIKMVKPPGGMRATFSSCAPTKPAAGRGATALTAGHSDSKDCLVARTTLHQKDKHASVIYWSAVIMTARAESTALARSQANCPETFDQRPTSVLNTLRWRHKMLSGNLSW